MAFEEVKGRVQNAQGKKSKKRSTSSGSEIDSDSSDDQFVPQKKETPAQKKKREAEQLKI